MTQSKRPRGELFRESRRRLQDVREANRMLLEQRKQLMHEARVLVREARAASAALRKTIRLPSDD